MMKKYLVSAVRLIVGLLFLFSGFVKMVDPIGFSYKLEEYFGPAVFNLDFLVPFALPIAIFIVIFEFILGVTLLLGYAQKFTRWSLVILTIFFTFLTFYSAYFNKVTDCGCFGDAIPLTPWQSFSKDVILLILVFIIFFNKQYIRPLFKIQINKWAVFLVVVGCLWLTYDVLMHLPIIDFRPYKIGANLEEGMVSDGPEMPPIHDFYIIRDGEDQTGSILNEDKVLFVTSYNMDKSERKGWKAVKKATDRALKKGYDVMGLSASADETVADIKQEYDLNFDFYGMDETTVKTIIRANPGLLTLHKGFVTQKVRWNDAENLNLE